MSMSDVPETMLMTLPQAAQQLNVSMDYLSRLLEEGELVPESVGGGDRLKAQDVLALKQRRRASRRLALDALSELGQDLQRQ